MKILLQLAVLAALAVYDGCFGQTGIFKGTNFYTNKEHLKQGETLEMICQVTEDRSPYVLQIYKLAVESVFPSGAPRIDEEVDHLIVNQTDLDPDLADTGRYSVNVSVSGFTTKLDFTISDIQPVDSGIFRCTAYYTEENIPSPASSLKTVNVSGPILKVELHSPPTSPRDIVAILWGSSEDKQTSPPDQSPLVVLSGTVVHIGCQVTLSNTPKWPSVQVFLGEEEVTSISRHNTGHITGNWYPGKRLESFVNFYFEWKMTLSLKDHGKNLSCKASQPPDMWTEPMSTFRPLNITGAPEGGYCDPNPIRAPLGTLDLQITCFVFAPEIPELSVSLSGPGDLGRVSSSTDQDSGVSLQWDGLFVNSSLILPNVTELGTYSVQWSNAYGVASAEVQLVSGAGALKDNSVTCLTLFALQLTLVLHRDCLLSE